MSTNTKSPHRLAFEHAVNSKIAVMDRWIKSGIPWRKRDDDGSDMRDDDGNKLLDFHPVNIGQFALWDGTQNCATTRQTIAETLTRVSTTTLNQTYHLAIRERVDDTLAAVERKALEQFEKTNKAGLIARLTDDNERLTDVVARQEHDIIGLRRAVSEAVSALEKEKSENARKQKQQEKDFRQLERKIQALSDQIQALSSPEDNHERAKPIKRARKG